MSGLDPSRLVAGLVVLALGAALLLQSTDVLDVSFAALAPAALGAAGAVLLAFGLHADRGRRAATAAAVAEEADAA